MTDSRAIAISKLDLFIKNGLKNYCSQRNYDFGPENHSNVSNLSPYIKKRIIHEKEVLKECLKNNSYEKIEKFVQEIFWRSYWKGWLEGRNDVWTRYKKTLVELNESYSFGVKKKIYQNALNGNTGIECFDFWVNELVKYGYLHNHTRMWFASIWIHTLNLPWQLGADFFLKNLLDGDAASNTLSWRWVAGLHTQGKNYLATEGNINKFTKNRFTKAMNLASKPKNLNYEFIDYKLKEFNVNSSTSEKNIFLINLNHMSYEDKTFEILLKNDVCLIEDLTENNCSKSIQLFNRKVVSDYSKTLMKNNIKAKIFENISDFSNFLKKNNYKKIHTFYPCIGRQKDIIDSLIHKNQCTVKFEYDKFDHMCWSYASSGFFKFKKKIPFFINEILSN